MIQYHELDATLDWCSEGMPIVLPHGAAMRRGDVTVTIWRWASPHGVTVALRELTTGKVWAMRRQSMTAAYAALGLTRSPLRRFTMVDFVALAQAIDSPAVTPAWRTGAPPSSQPGLLQKFASHPTRRATNNVIEMEQFR